MQVGDRVVWAIGLVPQREDQKYPGFGDTALVLQAEGEQVTVCFDRTGCITTERVSNFWPADSLVGKIASGISAMTGGQK